MGKSGKPLHYKGCTFHRVIPQFMLQVRQLWMSQLWVRECPAAV